MGDVQARCLQGLGGLGVESKDPSHVKPMLLK